MESVEEYVYRSIYELRDSEYKEFHSRLIPNVDKERIIGVRIPRLRRFAREFAKTPMAEEFMSRLPHGFYEENCLHGMLLSDIRCYEDALAEIERFLPHIDNWAVCDMIRPAVFRKNPQRLKTEIKRWISSEHEYTIRFGVEMMLCCLLDEAFEREQLNWVAGISSEYYYVKMMQAWYFAEALAKQREAAIDYMKRGLPDKWVHNKAIQKALESRRISAEDKALLRSLKRK